jgi:Cu+-exporting ATPase
MAMTEKSVTFPVTGMSCANCATSIERVVKKLPGVNEARVNFATEQASVSYDPEKVQMQNLLEKIRDAGYGVAKASVEIPVTGMTCANCAMTIERTLKKKVRGDERFRKLCHRAGHGRIHPDARQCRRDDRGH